jgi:predicted nucleic acid-binding protein
MPLPDFFIGAHAEVMGWPPATADEGRFRTSFPSVTLETP